MKLTSAGRLAPWMVVAGVAIQLVGLAVDGVLHSRVESATSESLVSLNPGHIGLGAGMALTAAGAALGIASRQAQRGASALFTYGPPVGLVVLGLVAGAFATQARGYRDDRHSERGGAATIAVAGQQPADHHANGSESAAVSAAPTGGGSAPALGLGGGAVHGHEGPSVAISYDEMRALAAQLDEARATAERYHDIRTALTDGYVQVTQDLPGIAAHFIRYDLVLDGKFEPSRPEMLLYSFRDGAWRFVGLSYAIPQTAGGAEPAGFAGPLDTWHYHENLCFRGGAVVGARSSPESCAARGGSFSARTFWMNHVWLAGAAPAADLFADANPLLRLGASWKVYAPGDPVAN